MNFFLVKIILIYLSFLCLVFFLATRSLKALYYSAKNDSYYDRKNAIKTIYFIKRIKELFKSNKIRIIKDDGSTIIFKID